jgi:hypothetical protein
VHLSVNPGSTGEHLGIAMVQVQGLPEGAELLTGSVGALLEGTLVKRAAGKS